VPHRKDKAEEQAIALLERVVAMSEADRDSLPGSAVSTSSSPSRSCGSGAGRRPPVADGRSQLTADRELRRD
jgi:hypothetical protein